MSYSRALALLPCLAFLALGGCNTMNSHIGDEDAALGETVKYNAAVQTINPAPVVTATAAQPGDSGDKGAEAVRRYRKDSVKPVETMGTTSGGSAGGTGMSTTTPHY